MGGGKLLLTVDLRLINIKGMMEVESHHLKKYHSNNRCILESSSDDKIGR